MKKVTEKLLGKKALYFVLTLTMIWNALEIVTAMRTGAKIDFSTMCVVYSMITIWSCSLQEKENEEKNS